MLLWRATRNNQIIKMEITNEAKGIVDELYTISEIACNVPSRSVTEQIVQFTLNERDKCDLYMATLAGM